MSVMDAPAKDRVRALLGPYDALRGNRDLTLLFIAQTLSALIDWLYVLALFVLAYGLTHSATTVALLTFVRLLPYALLLPFSGALTDRLDRKKVIVGADLGRALCMIALLAVQSSATLPLAFPLVFLATLLASLVRPATLSSLPAVVPERQLVQANSMVSQVDMASFGGGPALAGFILLLSGTRAVLLVATVGLVAAAAAVSRIHIPPHEEHTTQEPVSWIDHTVGGLRFLVGQHEGQLVAVALTIAGLTVFGGAYWAISVVLAEQGFHLGSQGVGFLNAAYALGGFLGGFLVGPLMIRRGITGLFIAAAAASSIAEALFGLSPAGALPFAFWFLVGLADAFAKIIAATVIQAATPRDLLGRVFGVFESALILSMVVGSLVIGPLIGAVGPRVACVVVAGAGLMLLVVSIPRLLQLENVVGLRVFVLQMPVLNMLSFTQLDDLVGHLQVERFQAGQDIVRQGERGDRFYLVKRGSVDILARGEEGSEVRVSTLARMDYFGETALLHDVPRTATVRAHEPLEVYSLSRENFQMLLRESEALQSALEERSAARDVARRNLLLFRV